MSEDERHSPDGGRPPSTGTDDAWPLWLGAAVGWLVWILTGDVELSWRLRWWSQGVSAATYRWRVRPGLSCRPLRVTFRTRWAAAIAGAVRQMSPRRQCPPSVVVVVIVRVDRHETPLRPHAAGLGGGPVGVGGAVKVTDQDVPDLADIRSDVEILAYVWLVRRQRPGDPRPGAAVGRARPEV